MTSPIHEHQDHRHVAIQTPPARRDWCCGTPITVPHALGCAYEPGDPAAAVSQPPPAPNPVLGEASAAASAASRYGFKKSPEFDLELPSGAFVRVRKIRKMQVIDLKVMDLLDGFAPELLKDIRGDDDVKREAAQEEAMRAMLDPKTSSTIFGPINRVVAAAVICPTVVMQGASTDEQMNVNEIEPDDKMAIFEAVMPDELKSAALGEQLAALKSVRTEPDIGVRDLRDGEAVLPEAQ